MLTIALARADPTPDIDALLEIAEFAAAWVAPMPVIAEVPVLFPAATVIARPTPERVAILVLVPLLLDNALPVAFAVAAPSPDPIEGEPPTSAWRSSRRDI